MSKQMKHRCYMVTLWKEPKPDPVPIQYFVYQKEKCPSTGKEHYQGYVEFKGQHRLNEVKNIFKDETMHIEPRQGTQLQAIQYCTKEDTRVEEPFFFGQKKQQGTRSDLDEIMLAIKNGHTGKEILHEFGGNALRHIGMIKTALHFEWNKEPIDEVIMAGRNDPEIPVPAEDRKKELKELFNAFNDATSDKFMKLFKDKMPQK